jgi:hypothetical protein
MSTRAQEFEPGRIAITRNLGIDKIDADRVLITVEWRGWIWQGETRRSIAWADPCVKKVGAALIEAVEIWTPLPVWVLTLNQREKLRGHE